MLRFLYEYLQKPAYRIESETLRKYIRGIGGAECEIIAYFEHLGFIKPSPIPKQLLASTTPMVYDIGGFVVEVVRGFADSETDAVPPQDTRCDDPSAEGAAPDSAAENDKGQQSLTVSIEGKSATLDGTTYDLTGEVQARWLHVLAEHPWHWISGPTLVKYDRKLYGARTDKVRKNLPPTIARLIEVKKTKGARLKLRKNDVTEP